MTKAVLARLRSGVLRLRRGTHEHPWLATAIVAFIALLSLAAFVQFGYNPPSPFQRQFSWFDPRGLRAFMTVGFESDGPLAAGNSIWVTGAQFTLTIYATPGPVEVEIAGDPTNSTGSVTFWLSNLSNSTPGFPNVYGSATAVTRDAGRIIPSVPGTLALEAWIKVTGIGFWQGWSQFYPVVDLAPSADYYTFLGLKTTAATVLTAAAFAAFPALESARRLWKPRVGSKESEDELRAER